MRRVALSSAQRIILAVALGAGLSIVARYVLDRVADGATRAAGVRVPNNSLVALRTARVSAWLVVAVWIGAVLVWGAVSSQLVRPRGSGDQSADR
jgi:hypothetical protein